MGKPKVWASKSEIKSILFFFPLELISENFFRSLGLDIKITKGNFPNNSLLICADWMEIELRKNIWGEHEQEFVDDFPIKTRFYLIRTHDNEP